MNVRGFLSWLAFVGYVIALFALPGSLLWGQMGFILGAAAAILFLVSLGFRGSDRIAKRLRVRPLSRAEAPVLYTLVEEHSRRTGIPMPRLGVLATPALNAATFGFTKEQSYLVVTEGMLKSLDREMLSALAGRLVTHLSLGEAATRSWLSQFLAIFDRLAQHSRPRTHSPLRRFYSFRMILRQTLFFPFALFPAYILKRGENPVEEDLLSLKITRRPSDLAEVYRRMEATQERLPLPSPLSCRHLFLLPPSVQDPVARIFFHPDPFLDRISHIESLKKVVPLGA